MKQDAFKEGLKKTAESTEAKLAKLVGERVSLAQEIARLDKEIAQTKKYLIGTLQMISGTSKVELPPNLAKMLGAQDQAGLKEVCLEVIKAAYEPLTATEIIAELRERNFPIDEYKKPLAVISTTLKRLVANKEAEEETKDGKTAYKWNPNGRRNLSFMETS